MTPEEKKKKKGFQDTFLSLGKFWGGLNQNYLFG